MAFRLFPRENQPLELLAAMAGCVVEATDAVSRMMGSAVEEHAAGFEHALEIEGRATDQLFALMTTVRSTVITPLPRGDLYSLGRELAQATEELTAACHVIRVHELTSFSHRASDMLELITRMATLTVTAMRHLSDLEGLDEYWVEVQRMAKQAVRTHDLYTADLMTGLKPRPYAQNAQFADKLDAAARKVRAVANDVGRISVQES